MKLKGSFIILLLALTFATADAVALPKFSGAIVLLDVLHYLHREQQQQLLRSAATRIAAGAILIIRTALREPTWRYVATVCEEHVLYGDKTIDITENLIYRLTANE